MIEHRFVAQGTKLLVPSDALKSDGEFAAQAMTYNVVDTYGTTFSPGAFSDYLSSNPLPPIVWGHIADQSPANVLGQVVDWQDQPGGLLIIGQLDPNNPHFDLVRGQLQSKTIRGVSVGFIRLQDEPSQLFDNVTAITKADLSEISLVVEPSVPGAQVLAIRNRAGRRRQRFDVLREADRIMAEHRL
jgi:HK97 family phage prohead protease